MNLFLLELRFAVLIFLLGGLRELMRNGRKSIMIILWDILLVRLFIPVSFTFKVKKDVKLLEYLVLNGEKTLLQGRYGKQIEQNLMKVSIAMLFCYIIFAFYFHHKMLSGKRVQYSKVIRRWGTGKHISVFESQQVSSVCTCGIWNPIILYPPSFDLEEEKALLVLEHEWNHICHMDVLRKHVIQMLVCLHWYNPAFWFLRKWVLDDIEMACDEAVIEKYGDSYRKEYAKLLISMVQIKKNMSGTYFNKNSVGKRVMHVVKFRKSKFLAIGGTVAAILFTGISCLKFTTYSKEQPYHIIYETESEEEKKYHPMETVVYVKNQNPTEEEQNSVTASNWLEEAILPEENWRYHYYHCDPEMAAFREEQDSITENDWLEEIILPEENWRYNYYHYNSEIVGQPKEENADSPLPEIIAYAKNQNLLYEE